MTSFTVRTNVAWSATSPATAVLLVRVAYTLGQMVRDEHLEVDGAEVEDPGADADGGTRPLRLHIAPGPVELRYRATVDVDPPGDATEAPLPSFGQLGFHLLPWTLPSRYCPSDVLGPTAEYLFRDVERTGALLEHVRSWVQTNIAYVPGTSDAHTAADETMLRRTGVCRDLAHLTVTLLRALGVPARVVGVYALDLQPPDFHAVVEAHDGDAWRLLDATGLASTDTLARIVTGRDAAEIAWGTTDGYISVTSLDVSVTGS